MARSTTTAADGPAAPEPDDLLARIGDLLRDGKPAEALALLPAAGPPLLRNARAVCLLRLGRPNQAKQFGDGTRANRGHPEPPDIRVGRREVAGARLQPDRDHRPDSRRRPDRTWRRRCKSHDRWKSRASSRVGFASVSRRLSFSASCP